MSNASADRLLEQEDTPLAIALGHALRAPIRVTLVDSFLSHDELSPSELAELTG